MSRGEREEESLILETVDLSNEWNKTRDQQASLGVSQTAKPQTDADEDRQPTVLL